MKNERSNQPHDFHRACFNLENCAHLHIGIHHSLQPMINLMRKQANEQTNTPVYILPSLIDFDLRANNEHC